ncbi:MAG: tetratricopeptide repeat protein [Pseudomonadota bacterium]
MNYSTVSTRLCLTALLGIVLAAPLPSHAGKPANITAAEMALLPAYCPDTMGFGYGDAYHNTSPNASKWVAMMGKDFWHMHHHCWALISYRRAERATLPASDKLRLRKAAHVDFWYVANNASPDFVMLPEIYTWIGRTELLLRNPRAAADAFARARTLKPDYVPAYTHLAEFFLAQGNRKEALKVVLEGLQHAPQAKGLLHLYRELGGKPENLPKKDLPLENIQTEPAKSDAAGQPDVSSPTAPVQQVPLD